MKTKQFIEKYQDIIKRKEDYSTELDLEYTEYVKEYLADNSPVERLKVYELIKNGNRRRGYKRFVVYSIRTQFMGRVCMINAGGWWLNQDNIPSKWDVMTVDGVSNPAIFKLSENQEHLPHPDSQKEKEKIAEPVNSEHEEDENFIDIPF